MKINYIDPWELSDHFPQSVVDFWKPYTDKLDTDDWYLIKTDQTQEWLLKTPFLSHPFDKSDLIDFPRGKFSPVSIALCRMDDYYKTIESEDRSISCITSASLCVEKWIRETYLHRY